MANPRPEKRSLLRPGRPTPYVAPVTKREVDQMPENLIEAEAADYTRTKPGTLANWRSLGKGPRYVRAGGRILYRKADLDRWLEKNATDPEAPPRPRRKRAA